MKRRSFLKLLGLAPVAPVALNLDKAIALIETPTIETVSNYVERALKKPELITDVRALTNIIDMDLNFGRINRGPTDLIIRIVSDTPEQFRNHNWETCAYVAKFKRTISFQAIMQNISWESDFFGEQIISETKMLVTDCYIDGVEVFPRISDKGHIMLADLHHSNEYNLE